MANTKRDGERVHVTLDMPSGATLLLFDENGDRRALFGEYLRESGFHIAATVSKIAKLGYAVRQYEPDAIVIGTDKPSKRLLTQIDDLKRMARLPVVLFSEDDAPETMQRAIATGVNAYIVLGLSSRRVRTAVDLAFVNFRQAEKRRNRAAEAEAALRDSALIERARDILMKQRDIDENTAYALLRDRAMQQGARIAEVARMIIDAADMLTEASDG
jgi:two-component system, response regulator / RNA-binding antiterminator